MAYYTYVVASNDEQTLFVGVTENLAHQVVLHWYDNRESFTPNKRVFKLLWYAQVARAVDAVKHARQLKSMTCSQLLAHINRENPMHISLNTDVVGNWTPNAIQIKQAIEWQRQYDAAGKSTAAGRLS